MCSGGDSERGTSCSSILVFPIMLLVCVEGAHLHEVGVFPAVMATNVYVVYKNLLGRGMRSHGTRASDTCEIKLKSDMIAVTCGGGGV